MDRKKDPGAAGQITDYLRELASAARVLPPERSRELIDDMRTHIDEALSETGREDPEAVRAVLAALGDPREIVSAALPEAEPAQVSRGITGLETAALVLLLFGAAALGVGWLVGVLLLWASPRWTRGEKLLGTLVTPGGVALPLFLAANLAAGSAVLLPLTLVAAAVVASSLTAVHLLRRARTAPVLDTRARWAAGAWAVGAVVLAIPIVGAVFFMGTSSSPVSSTPAAPNQSVVPTQSPS
jgi:hypothetical protein